MSCWTVGALPASSAVSKPSSCRRGCSTAGLWVEEGLPMTRAMWSGRSSSHCDQLKVRFA